MNKTIKLYKMANSYEIFHEQKWIDSVLGALVTTILCWIMIAFNNNLFATVLWLSWYTFDINYLK